MLHTKDLRSVGPLADNAERSGHQRVWVTEEGTDPFLSSYAATLATSHAEVGTAVAVAFARSPMTVAMSAWQLADQSEGRFILGLGSQVKAHIERRFSMPWGKPVLQMRDYIMALRAIWTSWRTGERLDHQGPYYTHTLSAPFWHPAMHSHPIPIWLAAVGPKMVELAGEMCDGLLLHPFSNAAYENRVVLPALRRGLAKSGRDISAIEISRPTFMVMGDDERQLQTQMRQARRQLAFYASTAAYLPVLDAIGRAELQPALARLVRNENWDGLADLIDDDFLSHFVLEGTPEEMPQRARDLLPDFVTTTSPYAGWAIDDPERLAAILSSATPAVGVR
ncbi:putative F420-dependent oxidoreductase [Mycolicibacterium rhodesiae JS60]|nr:putative F420-dependent oxidoreductase [Mycolicibacterium rhodesiae JS60]